MAVIVRIWTGDPVTGLWCPLCSLPSGFEVPLFCVSEVGVSPFGTLRRCYDCDARLEG